MLVVILVAARPPAARASSCCRNEALAANETQRRLEVRAADDEIVLPESVSRQGHKDPNGNSKKDRCPCKRGINERKRRLVVIGTAICLCAFAMTTWILLRGAAESRAQARSAGAVDAALHLMDLECQVEMAKRSLVYVDNATAEELCCVCLEPLDNDAGPDAKLERPPNCAHTYHGECIRRWIDAGYSTEGATQSSPSARRTARCLQCPVCAQTMLPLPKADCVTA